jgi:ribosomal protein S18 acetylase RimI-like enzyme
VVNLVVEPVAGVTDEVAAAFERLLPQLSATARTDRNLLDQLVAHDASLLFLARLDGRVVGATTLVIYPSPTGWRAHIDDVVVEREARGRGVGEALARPR